MCQWIPAVPPSVALPPPVFTPRLICSGVFFSSYRKWGICINWVPKNFAGQWHSSHVSRAGRRFSMGVGMGRGYDLVITARTWRTPEIFALTYQEAPWPTWQATQLTRAWGDARYAACSGSITVWHRVPQKETDSLYRKALYVMKAMKTARNVPPREM